jgi:hypothetical protein
VRQIGPWSSQHTVGVDAREVGGKIGDEGDDLDDGADDGAEVGLLLCEGFVRVCALSQLNGGRTPTAKKRVRPRLPK